MRMRLLLFLLLSISNSVFAVVQQFQLNNGLKLLVQEDHRAPIVVSMLWYHVGSADEPGGLQGVSHVLEHMMFKGTQKNPAGIFSKKIASTGGEENAFTNYDYTVYFEKVANTELSTVLALEADRMQQLLFDQQAFTKEMQVIQEERRLRTDNNPQAIAIERYMAAAYVSGPYHHPIIGWMDNLRHMTLQDAHAWYNNFYSPNNATLVIVGDVSAEKAYKLVSAYFSPLPARAKYYPRKVREPTFLGRKYIELHTAAQVPLIVYGYTVPSFKTSKQLWQPYALQLLAGILDADESARFTTKLVHGNEVASTAAVYYDPFMRYQAQFILYAIPTKQHTIEQLKIAMLKEIARLQTESIDVKELERVKKQMIAQKIFEKDSVFAQAMDIGVHDNLNIAQTNIQDYITAIQSITPKQIQQVARQYLIETASTEAVVFPQIQMKP